MDDWSREVPTELQSAEPRVEHQKASSPWKNNTVSKYLKTYYKKFISLPLFTLFVSGSFADWSRRDQWQHGNRIQYAPREPDDELCWRASISYLHRLGQRAGWPTPCVMVLDGKDSGQRPNVHLLIAGADHLPRGAIRDAWSWGNIKIDDATEYRVDYIVDKIVDHDAPWDRFPDNFDKACRRLLFKQRRRDHLLRHGGRDLPAKSPSVGELST